MMDPDLRDRIVAYVNADEKRTRVVKELEHKAEPLTTDYFGEIFWSLNDKQVLEILAGLESNKVICCLPGKNEKDVSWDLTLEGRESLYALEKPVSPTPVKAGKIMRWLTSTLHSLFKPK